MNGYAWLGLAIVAEVIATSALKASQGFTRPGPTALVVAGYGLAFWLLSLTLRQIPVGSAVGSSPPPSGDAIWRGVMVGARVAVAGTGVLVGRIPRSGTRVIAGVLARVGTRKLCTVSGIGVVVGGGVAVGSEARVRGHHQA